LLNNTPVCIFLLILSDWGFILISKKKFPIIIVWNNVKNKIGRSVITGQDALKVKAISCLRKLQKCLQIIGDFFMNRMYAT